MHTTSSKQTHAAAKRAPRVPQPIQAAALPDALLRQSVVTAMTGLSKTTLYRKIAQGAFPRPVLLSPRCARWRASDLRDWIAAQQAEGIAA